MHILTVSYFVFKEGETSFMASIADTDHYLERLVKKKISSAGYLMEERLRDLEFTFKDVKKAFCAYKKFSKLKWLEEVSLFRSK